MRFEDYYQVMGLSADADASAIKQAYRRLARLHHPDLHPSAEAHAAMLKINEAHEVLSDPQRRSAYDGVRRRHRPQATSSAPSEATSQTASGASSKATDAPDLPSDWKQGFRFDGAPTTGRSGEGFTEFFTSMFGRASAAEPPEVKPERGRDEHVKLQIDAKDATQGAVRSVTVRRLAPDEQGHRAVVHRRVQVQIPKGVKAGQHIRLPGQGSAGRAGADAGDLYLEIQFKPDAVQAPSRDVHEQLPLAPWEAALGSEVTAATPAGPVRVTVPPDTPHGKRLRLKGRGRVGGPAGDQAGNQAGNQAGDMLLEVEVVLPPSTLPGAREVYKTMAETLGHSFKPRAGAKS